MADLGSTTNGTLMAYDIMAYNIMAHGTEGAEESAGRVTCTVHIIIIVLLVYNYASGDNKPGPKIVGSSAKYGSIFGRIGNIFC